MLYNKGRNFFSLVHTGLEAVLGCWYFRRGQERVSMYDALTELWRRLHANDLVERAYGMAFNFTLAIFPATIFLFTLIPHFPIPDLTQNIILLIQEIMPIGLYEVLEPTIHDTLHTQRTGLLSLGIISTLYLATNGMMSLIKTLDLVAGPTACKKRGYLKQRGVALLLTLLLALVLLCAIALLTVGSQLLSYIVQQGLVASKWKLNLILGLRLLTLILLFLTAIACIYSFAPSSPRRGPFFSLGAVLATLLCLGVSWGFSYYVNSFANYNQIYGSIGILIAMMTWLFLLSVILLIGYEFDASLDAEVLQAANKRARK